MIIYLEGIMWSSFIAFNKSAERASILVNISVWLRSPGYIYRKLFDTHDNEVLFRRWAVVADHFQMNADL